MHRNELHVVTLTYNGIPFSSSLRYYFVKLIKILYDNEMLK